MDPIWIDSISAKLFTMDPVILETSLGDIGLELYWNHAPRASHLIHQVNNGLTLSRHVETLQNWLNAVITTA